jgi:hypothetical protein
MSHNTNSDRRARIVELLEEMDDPNSKLNEFYDLDSIIMEEFNCSRDAARKARKRVMVTGVSKSGKVENDGEEKDNVEMNFDTRQYEFEFKRRIDGVVQVEARFDIPFDQVTEYVIWYVRQGLNMTRKEVCRDAYIKHRRKLTHDYCRRMFRTLDVQKGTTPIAPHQYEEETKEELLESWHGRDEAIMEAKYYATEQRRLKQRLAAKTKELANIKDTIVAMVEEAEFTGLPNLDFENRYFELDGESDALIDVFTLASDWHYGLSLNEWFNEFNPEIARLRVEEMLEKTYEFHRHNKERIRHNHNAFLGDMLDGVMSDMHGDQHMEQSVFGARQAVECADLMAAYTNGMIKIFGDGGDNYAIVGNHDRVTKNAKQDQWRVMGVMTYMLAQEKSASTKPWVIAMDRPVIEVQKGKYMFLLGHGDKTPRDIRKMCGPRLRSGLHIVAFTGHKHSVQLSGVYDSNFTHIQNGALCGSTSYSLDQLGYHQFPAQVICEIGKDGIVPRPIFLTDHGCEKMDRM